MSELALNYVCQPMLAAMKRQAWKVWVVGLAIVSLWVFAIVAAPLAKADGLTTVSSPIYSFFSFLCHQISDRSFHVEGEQFAVCSRCFGVYFGLVAGFAGYPLWRGIDNIELLRRVWLFLSLIPITIDWSLTIFGILEKEHLSRFLTV